MVGEFNFFFLLESVASISSSFLFSFDLASLSLLFLLWLSFNFACFIVRFIGFILYCSLFFYMLRLCLLFMNAFSWLRLWLLFR